MIALRALNSGFERLLVRWCSIKRLVYPPADILFLTMIQFRYGATIWTAPIGV